MSRKEGQREKGTGSSTVSICCSWGNAWRRGSLPEPARKETESFSHSVTPHGVAKEAALLGGCKAFLFFKELGGRLDLGSWSLVTERCLLSHGAELASLVPLAFPSQFPPYMFRLEGANLCKS